MSTIPRLMMRGSTKYLTDNLKWIFNSNLIKENQQIYNEVGWPIIYESQETIELYGNQNCISLNEAMVENHCQTKRKNWWTWYFYLTFDKINFSLLPPLCWIWNQPAAGDFADWLKSLGSDGKVNMNKDLIKNLFSIGIEDDAAKKALYVAPIIKSAIPEQIANIVRLPDVWTFTYSQHL